MSELSDYKHYVTDPQIRSLEATVASFRAEVLRLTERERELEGALKPFADIGCPARPDYETVTQVLEIGSIRDARAALQPKNGKE